MEGEAFRSVSSLTTCYLYRDIQRHRLLQAEFKLSYIHLTNSGQVVTLGTTFPQIRGAEARAGVAP